MSALEFVLKFFTWFIPIKKIRRKIRTILCINILRFFLNKNFFNLKRKLKKTNNKIKVAFLVVFDSVFPASPLFELMLKDEMFEPYILVIPDVARGLEHQNYQLQKTYDTLKNKYGESLVKNSYVNNKFKDYSKECDIASFANPYDHMTHNFYTIRHYIIKGALPFYINYGTMPDLYGRDYVINLDSLNACWKVFVDTKDNLDDVKKYTFTKGKNAVLTGYCKMDSLVKIEKKNLERKKIIIAPHHTVENPKFPLSNFLQYSDFFLELPKKYPDIDFVFRPHPLLFVNLLNQGIWSQEKIDEYLKIMTSCSNVEYQEGGGYFETFVNSSAIIHDCSSFLMEYLYTGHPACYMLKDKSLINEIFAPIGQKCLENYYLACSEKDIKEFIDKIVISENDLMKENRINFAKNELMINYPNVAKFIIEDIKKDLVYNA